MIQFQNVSKVYLGGRPAVQNINFRVRQGEMVFLTGHSGAGKSTLLKLICRLERPNNGQIFFSGHNIGQIRRRDIPFLRRKIGVVFQDHQLLMDHTVYDNVAIQQFILGRRPDDVQRRVSAALDKVGLLDKIHCYPIQLSGGEQQRVGIARAIVNKPEVLLADEPTGNLDETLSHDIFRLFEEFNYAGVTVIMATHNTHLIHNHRHRTITLKDGRVIGDNGYVG